MAKDVDSGVGSAAVEQDVELKKQARIVAESIPGFPIPLVVIVPIIIEAVKLLIACWRDRYRRSDESFRAALARHYEFGAGLYKPKIVRRTSVRLMKAARKHGKRLSNDELQRLSVAILDRGRAGLDERTCGALVAECSGAIDDTIDD